MFKHSILRFNPSRTQHLLHPEDLHHRACGLQSSKSHGRATCLAQSYARSDAPCAQVPQLLNHRTWHGRFGMDAQSFAMYPRESPTAHREAETAKAHRG